MSAKHLGRLPGVVVGLALAITLSACTGGTTAESSAGASGGSSGSEAASPSVVTDPGATPPSSGTASPSPGIGVKVPADTKAALTVWLMNGSQPLGLTGKVTKALQQKYPNVVVDVQIQPWSGIEARLTEALDSGTAPDVVEVATELTARLGDAGLLADLTSQADALGAPEMLPGLRDSAQYAGKWWAIPYQGGNRIFIYRKSQFEDAGIEEPPQDYKQLASAARKLAEANKTKKKYSAFYFPGRDWYAALPFIWGYGGQIATQADGQWTGELDSTKSQAGLGDLAALARRYSKAPTSGDGSGNAAAFRSGEVGMMIDKWWVPGTLDSGKLKDDIGVFAPPGRTAKTGSPVYLGGSNLAVAANSPNQQLALEWIKLLTGKAFQIMLAEQAGVIPNQEGAFKGHADNKYLAVADAAALNSMTTPVSPNWVAAESAGILPDMLEAILSGTQTIPEATGQASVELAALLND